MLVGRRDVAVERPGDVVHAEDEMVLRHDAAGPLHQVGVLEQRHHMARAGLRDGLVQAGEGADVNHADSILRHRYRP